MNVMESKNRPSVLVLILCLAMILTVGLTIFMGKRNGPKKWAETAPLETITVQKGDKADDIMRSLLPTDRKETEDLGYLLHCVSLRTGEEYGKLAIGQELQMPISYGQWLQEKTDLPWSKYLRN